jgi:glycosyltransferase involved in cell wall biosynthesis
MKICLTGPGVMSIPPLGWGAVEILVWDYKCELERLGHQVLIVNTPNLYEIISTCNDFNPDFVHVQYDEHYGIVNHLNCKKIAITSHFGYLEQVFEYPGAEGYKQTFEGFRSVIDKCYIFCLSEGIKQYYIKYGFPENRLRVTPNGARDDLFKFNEICLYPNRSIYLAKIDYRKRQEKFRKYNANIYFAGNIADDCFIRDEFYLGEWKKQYLYDNLTNYANLVLLSDGEADPLVTKEAFMAGLGVVVSQYATANLDTSLPFIDVIPENRINDVDYVRNTIIENRIKSVSNRKEIKEYAKNFSWKTLIPKYVNIIETLLPKKLKIGIIVITTRKYKSFLNPILKSFDEYLLNDHQVEYNVFYDDPSFEVINTKRPIHRLIIPDFPYPYATLYRYRIINTHKEALIKYDYLLYIDVSMLVVAPVDETVINLNGLVAVEHPGFYKNKIGTYETNKNSLAYFDISDRKYPYVQGSVQGGKSDLYLAAVDKMRERIDMDEQKGIIALWHDESHWNKYINETEDNIRLLSPSYSHCKLPDVSPIILKLDKNSEIRS